VRQAFVLVRAGAGDLGPCGDPEHAGAGPDHGQPVAGLVGGRQRALPIDVGRFDAEGVQRDVLRGRREGHQQGAPGDGGAVDLGIEPGHADQARDDGRLRQQQPAAAAPHRSRQQRQGHAIDQRRPGPLEGVGQADPGEVADGGEVDARFAQPETQRAQHQQQRQPGREAQRQHAQGGGFTVDLEAFQPPGGGALVPSSCGGFV
jgi:hypothetical protein